MASSTSCRRSERDLGCPAWASRASSLEKPRCPPARGPSSTRKSGMRWWCLSHRRQMSPAARPPLTTGARAASLSGTSAAMAGRSRGSPAPQTTASTPARRAVRTLSAYWVVATMALMATSPAPWAASLARRTWAARARRLAPLESVAKSGSSKPQTAVEMVPMPPQAATAPARRSRLTPTPMPPWRMGRGRCLPRIVRPIPSPPPARCVRRCTALQRSAAGDGSRGACRPPGRS